MFDPVRVDFTDALPYQLSHVLDAIHDSATAEARVVSLANLCTLRQEIAQAEFFALPAVERRNPFSTLRVAAVQKQLPAVVRCLQPALAKRPGGEGRKDTNLTFIQDRILSSPPAERRAVLRLYQRVFGGKRMADDDRSIVQNRLELFGLVHVVDGVLRVRNEIYRLVFNAAWIQAAMPANLQRRLAIAAVVIALLAVFACRTWVCARQTRWPARSSTGATAARLRPRASLRGLPMRWPQPLPSTATTLSCASTMRRPCWI